jgi:DNA-binding response OmpR family regulator
MNEYKILIVEDERKTGEYLQKALLQEKIDSEIASDGKVAIELFEKNKYDLVVLDLKLPILTGDEVLKRIRELDPYIEVIVYTNYEEPPVMKKLLNLQVNGFLKKGPDANLWETVEFIKAKLMPTDANKLKEVLAKVI